MQTAVPGSPQLRSRGPLLIYSLISLPILYFFFDRGVPRLPFPADPSAFAGLSRSSIALHNGARVTGNGAPGDPCLGRYIYIQDLPPEFNSAILRDCRALIKWFDMCPYTPNQGFGPRLVGMSDLQEDEDGDGCLFNTNQFFLEVIFHARMKGYECLTDDSASASAVFVPFYAGLDVGRYLWDSNTSLRDSASLRLAEWLARRPEWLAMWGRDHFLITGRIASDFQRKTDGQDGGNQSDWANRNDWGNRLMLLPETKNMTVLGIESMIEPGIENQVAIPYPTYFHPGSDEAVFRWQERLRRRGRRRPYLFSFAGADRPQIPNSVRNAIMERCRGEWRGPCHLMECVPGSSNPCDDPASVIRLFTGSTFCLQPPGDSFTRRSIFDSIISGCIPVFFHPRSAYLQYVWHLPRNRTAYSVFISEADLRERNASVEAILKGVPEHRITAMREEVIRMIPAVVYAVPTSKSKTFADAFDIAVNGVLERVARQRRKIGL